MMKNYLFFLILICSRTHAQGPYERLDRYLSRPGVFNGTAMVVHKGQIVLHKGYGYKDASSRTLNDSTTIFRIGSISKPFTATIILHLAEKGLLHIDDHVSKFFPGYPHGDSITIAQLLTHQSGIKEYLTVPVIRDLPDNAAPISLQELVNTFKNEPRYIDPKEKLSYSNSNYILLAAIIQKVTAEQFEHVVRRVIFEPLNMHDTGFDFLHLTTTDKSTGHEKVKGRMQPVIDFDSTYAPGSGSMFSSVSDLYKWYQGLYSGAVISDSMREVAFIPRQWIYGYGWFSYRLYGRKCISHAGGVPGFVAEMKFFPEEDLFIVLLNNYRHGSADADKIAGMIFNERYQRSGL